MPLPGLSPLLVVCSLLAPALAVAQEAKLRVIAIGAHPDDCDIKFSGTATKMAKAGHAVKFLARFRQIAP